MPFHDRFYATHNAAKTDKEVSDTVTYYITNGGSKKRESGPGSGLRQLNELLMQTYGEDLNTHGKEDAADSTSRPRVQSDFLAKFSGIKLDSSPRKERQLASANADKHTSSTFQHVMDTTSGLLTPEEVARRERVLRADHAREIARVRKASQVALSRVSGEVR